MAPVENSAYPWCLSWWWASPRSAPTLALGWAEDPGHFPPCPLQLPAPRVLSGASHQRMSPLLVNKKLHASLAYGASGTSLGVYPGAAAAVGALAFGSVGSPTQPFNVQF